MDTLITLEEVATYLRLSKDTVYRMVQAGKIPASKVGAQWRFRTQEVDAWLQEQKNTSKGRRGTSPTPPTRNSPRSPRKR